MEIKIHPKYNLYEFNTNGQYRMIGKTEWKDGSFNGLNKYLQCGLKGKETQRETKLIHREMWETFKGPIPEKYEIDHLDSNKINNKLENLECVTIEENRKRSQKNNKAFRMKALKSHSLKKSIKGENIETKEIKYFKSKSQASKYYGCSPALVYLICEGLNNIKYYQHKIKFEYCENLEGKEIEHQKDKRIGRSKYTPEEKKIKNKENMKKYYAKKKANNLTTNL